MKSVWAAFNLAFELGYIIALPIVLLGFGGAYADKYFQTAPLFLLLGILFSLIISGIGIYRKIKDISK